MVRSFDVATGRPDPLGSTRSGHWINFALSCSPEIERVVLCLFQPYAGRSLCEICLDPNVHRTGSVWHIALKDLPRHVQYAYRLNGPPPFHSNGQLILDPYARAVFSHRVWAECRGEYEGRGVCDTVDPLEDSKHFDWEGDRPLQIPMKDLIIYEMHVRGFTIDPSSGVQHPGSFLGVVEKIPYLTELGINAVELLPVFEFNECSYQATGPVSGQPLLNYWGYMTLNFFSPMMRFASRPGDKGQAVRAITDFKTMVRELHKAGIEVILDVVYNHTGETGPQESFASFRGIDPQTYYMLDNSHFLNYSGCGNTFNANHPIAREFIVDSLRHWVSEMHVDGFRFDLASTLTRGTDGGPLPNPPVIEAIAKDPILANTKLIAEAWDAGGLYQVGTFPYLGRWSDWNGKYRDHIRRFIKGSDGEVGHFATNLCGSEGQYRHAGSPTASINFIIAHDGFTLRDLVSYDHKHNLDNGEENRDGTDDNNSWNCGHEGETANRQILALRRRQMRNLHLALMLSQGVPMIVMGDEYGHTRYGNNNTWCHDNHLNWFLWEEANQDSAFLHYYKALIHFRRSQSLLTSGRFLTPEDITWHGLLPGEPDWSYESHFLAFTLHDHVSGKDLYAAFNASHEKVEVTLPTRMSRSPWCRIVDTGVTPPRDFIGEDQCRRVSTAQPYPMLPYSAILLKAIPRRS